MTKLLTLAIVLLATSSALAIDLSQILGITGHSLDQRNAPEVVEVIRWRQPVCLVPGPGVPPCLLGLRSMQSNVQSSPENLLEQQESSKANVEELSENKDQSARAVGEESLEKEPVKLLSTDVMKSVPLDKLQPSIVEGSLEEASAAKADVTPPLTGRDVDGKDGGSRRGRYLVLPSQAKNFNSRHTIYTTKVIDSPVVATLVATNCLPDIGVPLCEDIPAPVEEVVVEDCDEPVVVAEEPEEPTYVVEKPKPSTVLVTSKPSTVIVGEESHFVAYEVTTKRPHKPAFLQGIHDFINRPDKVDTNKEPEVKPVLVVEPTPKPGLFGNHGWFNMFHKPEHKPEVVIVERPEKPVYVVEEPHKPVRPTIIEVPEKPSLTEILYKPENDISNKPGLFDVFQTSKNGNNDAEVVAKPTKKPGILGGLFSNPVRPVDPESPGTARQSIFNGLGNIFTKPTSKPLVIDRPDEVPLVVEKPVYVVERPVIPGLSDIFHRHDKKPVLNEDHEVIKDPVYVYQKPPNLFGGLFNSSKPGLFEGWNIFHKPHHNNPTIVIEEPAKPILIHKPHKPEVIIEKPQPTTIVFEKPSLPHKPTWIPEKPHKPHHQVVIIEKPTEPTIVVGQHTLPETPVVVEEHVVPHKPEVIYEKPHKPTIVVEHPPPIIIEKPAKPTVIEHNHPHKPIVVVEKPEKPTIILEHPQKPVVIVEKPHKPTIVVEKPEEPKPIVVISKPPHGYKPVLVEDEPQLPPLPPRPYPVHPPIEGDHVSITTTVSSSAGTASTVAVAGGGTAEASSQAIAAGGASGASSQAVAAGGASEASSNAHAAGGASEASSNAHAAGGASEASSNAYAAGGASEASSNAYAAGGASEASSNAHAAGGASEAHSQAAAAGGASEAFSDAYAAEDASEAFSDAYAAGGASEAFSDAYAAGGASEAFSQAGAAVGESEAFSDAYAAAGGSEAVNDPYTTDDAWKTAGGTSGTSIAVLAGSVGYKELASEADAEVDEIENTA